MDCSTWGLQLTHVRARVSHQPPHHGTHSLSVVFPTQACHTCNPPSSHPSVHSPTHHPLLQLQRRVEELPQQLLSRPPIQPALQRPYQVNHSARWTVLLLQNRWRMAGIQSCQLEAAHASTNHNGSSTYNTILPRMIHIPTGVAADPCNPCAVITEMLLGKCRALAAPSAPFNCTSPAQAIATGSAAVRSGCADKREPGPQHPYRDTGGYATLVISTRTPPKGSTNKSHATPKTTSSGHQQAGPRAIHVHNATCQITNGVGSKQLS